MGCFVNPLQGRKEAFLWRVQLREIPLEKFLGYDFDSVPVGHFLVVLVHNAVASSAMVCFDEAELTRWQRSASYDPRPITYFLVHHSHLWNNSDLGTWLDKEQYLQNILM